MKNYPNSFYFENQKEIDRRAAQIAKPPRAVPIHGAFIVAFISGLMAIPILGFAGIDSKETAFTTISLWVALVCGGIVYLVLRLQENAFYRIVSQQAGAMWEAKQQEALPKPPLEGPPKG